MEYLTHDHKLDDPYLNHDLDVTEPTPLGSDPMYPRNCKVTLVKANIMDSVGSLASLNNFEMTLN